MRACRCDAIPLRALQTAGMLFEHRNLCHAPGDRLIKITSNFSEPFNKAISKGRRRLHAASAAHVGATARDGGTCDTRADGLFGSEDEDDDDTEWPLGPVVRATEAAGVAAEAATVQDSALGGAGRVLLQSRIPPEYGFEREKQIFGRAVKISKVQRANLKATRWMGAFEPMLPSCPITARKIAPEAVSEFASLAWRCDGLGFSWDCLQGSAPIEDLPMQPPPTAANASASNATATATQQAL